MKAVILIIMVTMSLLGSHIVLSPGTSIHGEKKDQYGDEFNSEHIGAGYTYSNYSDDKYFNTTTVLLISDSYKNPMLSITYGFNYMVVDNNDFRVSIGAEFGLGYKKAKIETYDDRVYKFVYYVVPVAFIPKVMLEYDKVSLFITYVPEVHIESGDVYAYVDEVTYINFGYRF